MLDENIKENEQVEAKEEAPTVEEKQVEEQPVVDKSYDQIINDARMDLYKNYTRTRRISNILMFVVVGAIVGISYGPGMYGCYFRGKEVTEKGEDK